MKKLKYKFLLKINRKLITKRRVYLAASMGLFLFTMFAMLPSNNSIVVAVGSDCASYTGYLLPQDVMDSCYRCDGDGQFWQWSGNDKPPVCVTCSGHNCVVANAVNGEPIEGVDAGMYHAVCRAIRGSGGTETSRGVQYVQCKDSDGNEVEVTIENSLADDVSDAPRSNFEGDCKDSIQPGDCGITSYILTFTNMLSAVVGIVIVIMIVVGGIQYSMARDNPQAVQAAKGKIINALLALTIYIFMFAFLQWIVPGGVFNTP